MQAEGDGTLTVQSHNQYDSSGLDSRDLKKDPMETFKQWFKGAIDSGVVDEPESVCLSTVSSDGRVSSRFVLLKRIDDRGFVFFTNYDSRKATELSSNPRASMAIYWSKLFRQVRINGSTERIESLESLEYFNSRPIGSRIGAWASPQSKPIRDRQQLVDNLNEVERRFGLELNSSLDGSANDQVTQVEIPLPPNWGGIRLVPDEIEFWAGRRNRLHDRFVYRRSLNHDGRGNHSEWILERLAP
ncbi:hypothetical protein BY996DRAFT_268344 [Phakopsora pachyrhizi]|nr:hypothetical protein BY996DRAFT_268344 [Phakopsora pachyrhizi]